jgi:Endoribonuclease L-PSP.
LRRASAISCSSRAFPGFDANGALPDGFEAQFANVVVNIKRVLGEAGASVRDLVKVNVL